MTSACRRFADAYTEASNRGDHEAIAAMMAPDVIFYAPHAVELRGRKAAHAFFREYSSQHKVSVRMVSFIESGDACAFEFEARIGDDPDLKLAAIDHVTLDAEGKATRFAIYLK